MKTLSTYNCTGCEKPFSYYTKEAELYVCPFCFAQHSRKETITPVNKSLPIPEHMSLLMLGSELIYEKQKYVIVGCYHYRMNKGYKNKWILSDENGDMHYVIEATGYYTFCKKYTSDIKTGELKQLHLGKEFSIEGIADDLYVDGIDKNSHTFFIGELPEVDHELLPFFAADLSNNTDNYAFAQVFDKKNAIIYLGKYGLFIDFNFSKTKSINGWK